MLKRLLGGDSPGLCFACRLKRFSPWPMPRLPDGCFAGPVTRDSWCIFPAALRVLLRGHEVTLETAKEFQEVSKRVLVLSR